MTAEAGTMSHCGMLHVQQESAAKSTDTWRGVAAALPAQKVVFNDNINVAV